MLIYLSDSVAKKAGSGLLTVDDIAALDQAAVACRAGKHVMFAERQTLFVLKDLGGFSLAARSLFLSLYNRYSTHAGVMGFFSSYIEVCADATSILASEVAGIKKIVVPLSSKSMICLAAKTKLVLEFIHDRRVYDAILKWYISAKGLASFSVCFDVLNGGGGTTGEVFYTEVSVGESICICIVDSDVKYPGCRPGATSSAIVLRNGELSKVSSYFVVDAHEIENLIPREVYAYLGRGDATCQSFINHMSEMELLGKDECWMHVDVKKGVCVGLAKSDAALSSYWSLPTSPVGCAKACTTQKDCNCFVVPPWSKKTELKDWCKNVNAMPSTTDVRLINAWSEIGDFVFNWCATRGPIST